MKSVKQEWPDTPNSIPSPSRQKNSASPQDFDCGATTSTEVDEQFDMNSVSDERAERRSNEHLQSPSSHHTNYPTTDIRAERVFVQGRAFDGQTMKRRRAKRTEAERIEYLQKDPYVSRFEAYRVLCASCSRWIRLRPNSTYCSIPWESHRKSCLGKKLPRNDYAVERLNHMFSNDSAIRKYDSERILCRLCDAWIDVSSGDYQQSIDTWLNHKAKCISVSPTPIAFVETPSPHTRAAAPTKYLNPSSMDKPKVLSEAMSSTKRIVLPPLISRNRTPPLSPPFCPLSSSTSTRSSPPSSLFNSGSIPWLESSARSSDTRSLSRLSERHAQDSPRSPVARQASPYLPKRARPVIANLLQSPAGPPTSYERTSNFSRYGSPSHASNPSRQSNSRGHADLISAHGRRGFILSTIIHLYSTTYEASDDLTVSVLLSYLNAAMPPDKYEEFDTHEVVKAVMTLQDKGHVVFHGDSLRPCD